MKTRLFALFASLGLLMSGCTVPDEPVDIPTTTATTVVAPDVAGDRYTIVPGASWLRVRVYKTGALARFGHDHVVASTALQGTVMRAPALEDSAFALTVPLAQLTVDDPAARRAEGSPFEKDIPEDDRVATQRNMLGEKLLNAANFPQLTLTSMSIDGAAAEASADVIVNIAGTETVQRFAFSFTQDGDRLLIEGSTELTHAQLGLEPFSALGGALRVRDDIGLRYYIVAELEKETL